MFAPLGIFKSTDGSLEIMDVVGDDWMSRRLCELGFSIGRAVRLVRPGNPAIVEASGTRFAIGDDLQSRVLVRPAS